MTTVAQRMEKAFLKQCFILINEVQGKVLLHKEFQPYRKSLWQPKNRGKKTVKIG
jgi:hypothetical protein